MHDPALPSADPERAARPRPWRLAHLPPVEAGFRVDPDDFEVEELPAYGPCGAGAHVLLWIEKRGLSTFEALRRLALRLGIAPHTFGYAGLKDARSRSWQQLSLPWPEDRAPEALLGTVCEGLVVHRAARHRNKLRRGHLRGNRFRIRLRGVSPAGERVLREGLACLARHGAPNRFGAQRFGGPDAVGARLGVLLLAGEADAYVRTLVGGAVGRPRDPRRAEALRRLEAGDPAAALAVLPARLRAERAALRALARGRSPVAAVRAVSRELRRIHVSAAQSVVFNALHDARLAAGTLGTLERGDVAWLHDRGACFVVEQPEREQPRADRLEISPAGPLFGTRVLAAAGAVERREHEALRADPLGEALERAEQPPRLVAPPRGARRPYRVPLADPGLEREGDDVWLAFTLPPGSYATTVCEELLKRPLA